MNTVFLTGGTGVVGSAVARVLLDQPDTRIILLVRGDGDRAVQERVAALAAFWNLPQTMVAGRVDAVRGDSTLPQFGLTSGQYETLTATCSHIVHCAAMVRMNLPLPDARASAVDSARSILELARSAHRNGRLCKVEFVSTVGVGGKRGGILPERWITAPRAFHNTYEEAKAEAEVLVAQGVAEGLPITVHRPSMVVGDSRTGASMRFQIFYHLVEFLSGRRTFGLFPALGAARLDIVPVDYVAAAVAWSCGQPATIGRVLHLCTGPRQSPTLRDLQVSVRTAFVAAGKPVPRRIFLPPRLLRSMLPVVAAAMPRSGRRALAALPIFLDYLGSDQGFANDETCATLRDAGIALPGVATYLPKVLEVYLRQKSEEPAR